MSTPESAADVLDRELANTQRAGIVTAAAIAVASAGALDVIGALQLWSVVRLFGVYQYVPHALFALGRNGIGLVGDDVVRREGGGSRARFM